MKNKLFYLLFPLLAVALAIGILIFSARLAAKRQNPTSLPQASPLPTVLPTTQTEFIEGKTISFKNNLLTLKKNDGHDIQLQIATPAAILKQKWFNANSMGTVPAEVKANDRVSVQTTKNSSGEAEAISVVILTDKPGN